MCAAVLLCLHCICVIVTVCEGFVFMRVCGCTFLSPSHTHHLLLCELSGGCKMSPSQSFCFSCSSKQFTCHTAVPEEFWNSARVSSLCGCLFLLFSLTPSLTLSDCFPEKMLHKCSSSLSIEKIPHESDFLGTNVTCAVSLIWSEISLQIQIERFGTKERMLQYRLYLEPVANDAQA